MADAAAASTASPRVVVALVAGQLGLHAAMAGLRLAAPLHALRDGASAWAVGVLLALFAVTAVAAALPAGRLADRLGYHRPVHAAVALSLLGGALALTSAFVDAAPRFMLLCAAAAVTGAGANLGMLTIQRAAGIAARDPADRVRLFSWLGIAPSLSNVVGPVAAGLTIDAAGFGAAYALLLALPLVSVAAARFVPRVERAGDVGPDGARRSWQLLRTPGMVRLLAVNWLLSMCWDVHTFAVPIIGHERAFSASTIGLILGTFTAAVTLVRLAIPLLAERLPPRTVLAAAMAGTAVVFAAYPWAVDPWTMGALAAVLGVLLGCVQPMVLTMLHDLTPERRYGEALALRSMAINTSGALLPLAFGAAGAVVGAAPLFWAVAAAVGCGAWSTRGLRAPVRATAAARGS